MVLLDYKLDPRGIVGMEALIAFRERCPAASIVVVSGETRADEIRRMIDPGAAGFIPKAAAHEVFGTALNLVLAGGSYLPPEALDDDGGESGSLIEQRIRSLTQRPREVLKLIVQG